MPSFTYSFLMVLLSPISILLVLYCICILREFETVVNCDAGLFHLTGLVHVSEVSWDLIQDIRDILNEGDEVRVKVIKIDRYVYFATFSYFKSTYIFETTKRINDKVRLLPKLSHEKYL